MMRTIVSVWVAIVSASTLANPQEPFLVCQSVNGDAQVSILLDRTAILSIEGTPMGFSEIQHSNASRTWNASYYH